jgi:AraC-like DNA-binding protein
MSCLGLVEAMHSTDLSLGTRAVWFCLENHADRRTRLWSITYRQIAAEMGISEDTVLRGVRELVKAKVIEVMRRYRKAPVFRMLHTYQKEELDPHHAVPTPELDPHHAGQTEESNPHHAGLSDPVIPAPCGSLNPSSKKETHQETLTTTPESVSPRAVVVADDETPETLEALDVIRAWNEVAEACRYPFEDEATRTTPWLLRAVMAHGKAKLIEAIDLLGQPGFFRDRATKSFRLVQLSDARMLNRILGREFVDDRQPRKSAHQQKQADYADTLRELGEFFDNMGAKPYATQEHSA